MHNEERRIASTGLEIHNSIQRKETVPSYSNQLKGLKPKTHETIKLIQENIEGKLHGIHCGNDIMDVTPKTQTENRSN